MALDLEKINKIPTPQKLVVLVALVIGMYVAFWFLFVTPRTVEIAKEEEKYNGLQKDILKLQAVEEQEKEYKAKRKILEEKLILAKKKLPSRAEIPELLARIDNLGRGTRLAFKVFKPGKERRGKGEAGKVYFEVPIKIALEGTFHQVAAFFDRLSRLERIMNVNTITIKPMGGGLLKIDCELVTFRFAEEKKKPPPKKKGRKEKRKGKK